MKIYHKKNFTFGLFSMFLGDLNLVLAALRGFDIKEGVLIALLLIMGSVSLVRSLSQKYSREDRLEELDERNRLVKLRAQSQTYLICQFVYLGGSVALCAWGKIAGSEPCMYIGLGMLAAFFIALTADFLTWMYYDDHT